MILLISRNFLKRDLKRFSPNTWDKFIIPRMFNTINIRWGKPISIEYIENGKYQKALTAELNKITDESNYFEIKK